MNISMKNCHWMQKTVVAIGCVGGYCFGLELAEATNMYLDKAFDLTNTKTRKLTRYARWTWTEMVMSLLGASLGFITTYRALEFDAKFTFN